MRFPFQPRQGLVLLIGSVLVFCLLAADGCPVPGFPGGAPVVRVTSPSLDKTTVAGDAVTMIYDVVASGIDSPVVSAFYDRDGMPGSGDDVVFATNLATGTNRVVSLDTSGIDPGHVYNLGIKAQSTLGASAFGYAGGKVMLVAAPDLVVSSPSSDLTVGAGTEVPVTFAPGPDVIASTYRVFYDTDGLFDGDEVLIAQSTSPVTGTQEVMWDTSNLAGGTYRVGVRITTPEGGLQIKYAEGRVTITAGAYLEILSPSGALVVEAGTQIEVLLAAGSPSLEDPVIRVFYDRDQNATNGNSVEIDEVTVSSPELVWDTGMVPEPGLYYLGAEMLGETPRLVTYTDEPIQIVGAGVAGGGTGRRGASGTARLTMRSPITDTTVWMGELYTVRWSTDLRVGEGTIELFREPDVDRDGQPDGEDKRVLIAPAGLDASTKSWEFDTRNISGKYYIGATVTVLGGESETDYAEGSLSIIPAWFWVGHLRTFEQDEEPPAQTGIFQGAIFRGHNVGDNLGSAMLVAGDYAGPATAEPDGIREIVLAAQFGKPFFLGAGGRGAGEAYLIYGSRQRYIGDYDVNMVGAGSLPGGSDALPGLILTGIAPNPYPPNTPKGLTGTTVAYTVEGEVAPPYTTEGLCSLALIPDQDGDGLEEIAVGFPYANSWTLYDQALNGTHPAPLPGIGRLENNGHFLRGGIVIVASTNDMLTNPARLSRHYDRVMMLQEVGQVFTAMRPGDTPPGDFINPALHDFMPLCCTDKKVDDVPDVYDIAFFPGEGFYQNTLRQTTFPMFGLGPWNAIYGIDPPRLADPQSVVIHTTNPEGIPRIGQGAAEIARGEVISLSQIDPPPSMTDENFLGGREYSGCVTYFTDADGNPTLPWGEFPTVGTMRVMGTGFYYDRLPNLGSPDCGPPFLSPYHAYCPSYRFADSREPYGARLLGQTTTQLYTNPPTTANRFAHIMAVSGHFLLITAPNRTVQKADVTALRLDPMEGDRVDSGEVYMLQLNRNPTTDNRYLWNPAETAILDDEGNPAVDDDGNPIVSDTATTPTPHQYIIQDVGYTRCWGGDASKYLYPGDVAFELSRPFHIVGMPGDHIGEVTGLKDLNNDGVDDFAVGGAGTNGDRGAVYVLFRRQPEIEADYLLERLQLDPSDLNRLVGLMILGRRGEQLGMTLTGGGSRDEESDDFNDDGFPDMVIGSPYATPGTGYHAGEAFILFGDRTSWVTPSGGSTIPELVAADRGMVVSGEFAGDEVGTTVAHAGDVNGDGIPDFLASAPKASPRFDSDGDGIRDTIGLDLDGDWAADDLDGDGRPDDMTGAGLVYVIFGGQHLQGTISLQQIGTKLLPGIVIVGRGAGDALGGGLTQNGRQARGLNSAGDMDGDGKHDLLLSSVLADPNGKTDAGEVYLVYGFSTPVEPVSEVK